MELRHYQKETTPAILNYIRKSGGGNPVVALPTGAGKTLCIADLVDYVHKKWNSKVLVLSHVREILEQNHAAIEAYTGLTVGINSAGLGRREVMPVTVAGIQSVFRNPEQFKDFNLIIIDEAHLLSEAGNTMYRRFFDGIGKHTKVGFTATPYRMNTGYIYGPGEPFDSLVLDWSKRNKFISLIDDGYLSKIVTKRTTLEMDTTGIKMVGGDFNEKELADRFDKTAITNSAIQEIMAAGKRRKKWLIFAIDIEHAEHITEILLQNGIKAGIIHSKVDDYGFFDRETILGMYKDGNLQCIVNVNILTTGFDAPDIDLIGLLRPTKSPVLHVQMVGRGSRIAPDKHDCLVLDFAGNTERLGPINDPLITIKGIGKGGDPITKTCPVCDTISPPAVRVCPECDYQFKFEHRLNSAAYGDVIIDDGKPAWLKVDQVKYALHANYGSPTSVKVTYVCGHLNINEYVCIEHKGFASVKAAHWNKYRGGEKCDSASDLIKQADKLKTPLEILVGKSGKYHVVKDAVFV